MSKKFIIILISAVLGLLLLSLIGYYFIIQNGSNPNNGGVVSVFKNFFPFGGNDLPASDNSTTTPQTPENPQQPVGNSTAFTQKLRELSKEPVAGAGVLDVKAGTVVRYIEKATGHIYEVELFSPRQERISNTTIPLVADGIWGNGNNSLITRYIGEDDVRIDTYSMTIKNISTSTTASPLVGTQFPSGISDVSAYGSNVFYLVQNDSFSQGFVSAFDGSKKKLIWSSEIKELTSQFVNDRTVALYTNPYPNIPGYLYLIDTVTGSMRKVIGEVSGLTALVNSQVTSVLILSQDSNARLFDYDIKSKKSVELSPKTFPEKCVWSKKDAAVAYCAVPRLSLDGGTLTLWYQGRISFTDDIWKYNLKDNTSSIVGNLSGDSGMQIDVIKPQLSASEQYLVFVNKIDNSLWSLDLTK